MNEVLFSSNTDDWATPQDLFDALDAEFHFTLDPCSSEQNHKCDRYFITFFILSDFTYN